jgi:hypothetical protein
LRELPVTIATRSSRSIFEPVHCFGGVRLRAVERYSRPWSLTRISDSRFSPAGYRRLKQGVIVWIKRLSVEGGDKP